MIGVVNSFIIVGSGAAGIYNLINGHWLPLAINIGSLVIGLLCWRRWFE